MSCFRYLFILILLISLSCCKKSGNTAADKVSASDISALFDGDDVRSKRSAYNLQDSEDKMSDFVMGIYKEVFSAYNTGNMDRTRWIDKYCSDECKDLYRVCDSLTEVTDYIVGTDFDEWIWGQDVCGELSAKVVGVELLSREYGMVKVEVLNGEFKTYHVVAVSYDKSKGRRFIEDFMSYGDDGVSYSVTRDMKQQIYTCLLDADVN